MSPSFSFGWDSCENPYSLFPPGITYPSGCADMRDFLKLHARLEVLGIGVWMQRWDMVDLSISWHRLFDVQNDGFFKQDDYLRLIDNPEERERVKKFRDNFRRKPLKTRWTDRFTLAGKRVHSRAFVMENETLFGVDILE